MRENLGAGTTRTADYATKSYVDAHAGGTPSVSSTATAAGTTSLSAASNQIQIFTGTTTQTVTLPTTSVTAGMQWEIANQSTGAVTVNASGGGTVLILAGGTTAVFTATTATPTTSTGWQWGYGGVTVVSGKLLTVNNSLALTGTDGTTMTFPATSATMAGLATAQTLVATTLQQLLVTTTTSSASTLTLTSSNSAYVYSGSATTTWTLPAVSGNTNGVLFIENRTSASGAITLNSAGSDHIWFLSSLTSMTIAAGGSLMLVNDGTYWNALSVDLAHNAVGILPAANGGTGQSSLTSLTLTTPTITGYTETVDAVGNTGTAKTLSLSTGTFLTATLTGNCTFTMPTATAGQSFVLLLKTGAGSFTGTFTSVKWAGGTAPTITTTASRMDLLSFFSDGTDWYGSFIQNYTP